MRRKLHGRLDVFVDTQPLLAAINKQDPHQRVCVEYLEQFAIEGTRLVTSDWVLAEFLSAGARLSTRNVTIGVVEDLRMSELTSIVPATRKTWNEAFDLFVKRKDKEWSLVDCTSIVLCRRFGITRVLTHDHHFTQAGLEILIP